jgi:hypothetical protein
MMAAMGGDFAGAFRRALPNAPPGSPDNWALFDRFLDLCERHRWKMADVRSEIESVDPRVLTENDLRVLDCVGEVALVEGNAPSIVVNQLAIMLHDAEFAAWATYQVGEEHKHFHAVRHYLARVGHPIAARHDEASWVRHQKGFQPDDFGDEHACILINVLGETLNIHLYQVLAERADEPVLKQLLLRISRDERRHLQWFLEYFAKRKQQDAGFVDKSLAALKRLLQLDDPSAQPPQRHQGSGVDSYLEAAGKLLRHGYSLEIVTRAAKEQWALVQDLFGPALDIERRQFLKRQMAYPTAAPGCARDG